MTDFERNKARVTAEYEALINRKNIVSDSYNGIYDRYVYPVLTAAHAPIIWKYDMNPETNPYFIERLGINAAFLYPRNYWQATGGNRSSIIYQSLCLYFSYLSFQTIFFDRFIACFRIKGNVGFFIAMVDSIGYTGTVVVLVVKECFNPDLNWLEFYNTMAGTVGIVCTFAFTLAMIYLTQKYRKGKQGEIRGNESCPVPSLASY